MEAPERPVHRSLRRRQPHLRDRAPTAPSPVGVTTPPGSSKRSRPASSTRSPRAATHTCAIAADGTLACWGDDSAGQLDEIPSTEYGAFASVAAGGAHTCALRTTGTLKCSGDDSSGQVSDAPRYTVHYWDWWWGHWHLDDTGSTTTRSPREGPTPARSGPTAPSPAGAMTPPRAPPLDGEFVAVSAGPRTPACCGRGPPRT